VRLNLDQFSGLVAGIYDAALDGSQWEPTLLRIVSAFEGNGGALMVAGPQLRHVRYTDTGTDQPAVKAYNDYYWQMDPVAPALGRAPAGSILSSREIATSDPRSKEFYNDFAVAMLDAGDSLFVNLMRDGDGIGWLCVSAPSRPEPFGSPGRMRLMRALMPHLRQAMRVQASVRELEFQRQNALDTLDRLAHGVVLFGGGEVLFANRAASRICASRDGLTIGRAGVRAALRHEDAALQCLVGGAGGDGNGGVRAGGTVAVTRSSGQRPFVIHVLPAAALNEISRAGSVLAVIVDPEREPPLLTATLRRLYRLTPAEATVASEVLKGEGLQAVADRMSVTISTVRIHLQRVFDKTHTHRQAELARLLLTIDAGLDLGNGRS
jgi:DNA-binding CsgD family transcriptional regulator